MIIEFLTVCALVLLFFVYAGFFYKINWIRDLTQHSPKSTSELAKYKTRKNREIGQLPPVYPNGWFGLLESSTLKRRQVEHVAALGQNFAVFRTESGAVRIVDAYCPHLGANMAEGGQVKGEELECPFHSWRFCGETGKCTSIPYSKNLPSKIKTKVWDSFEANGVIFVWFHAESNPPDWWPQPIEEISNNTWKYQGRNEFYINCHIQEIPENGADWAHLSAVHGPSMVATDYLSKIIHHSWTNAAWSTQSSACQNDSYQSEDISEEISNDKHVAISRLRHNLVLFNKYPCLELNVEANQIGPGYVKLHLQTFCGPMCIMQTVTPLQPLLQKVTHLMFAPLLASPYARLVLIGECIMFERDILVWNHKKYIENPMLVSEDRTIKAYRRWYKQFYSENSPTYESCRKTIDW